MFNFRIYNNVTSITFPSSVKMVNTDFNNAFNNMQNLQMINFNHPNVTNMSSTYYNCRNLTGNPVCGDKVTNMSYAY